MLCAQRVGLQAYRPFLPLVKVKALKPPWASTLQESEELRVLQPLEIAAFRSVGDLHLLCSGALHANLGPSEWELQRVRQEKPEVKALLKLSPGPLHWDLGEALGFMSAPHCCPPIV